VPKYQIMSNLEPLYPAYSRPERIADGVIHAIGVAFALSGAVTLIVLAGLWAGGAQVAATTVYGAALIATFAASALYHMTPREEWRPVLRRIDHAAIYLKIAGTYTPFVVMIGSAFAYGILALVWALALAGALAKVFFWRSPGRLGTLLYLALGWLAVLLIWPIAQTQPAVTSGLVVAGGLLYTAGVMFFTWESLRFSNAIWHGFVLAASGCFFAAILAATVVAAT
jgi:hemolysin III